MSEFLSTYLHTVSKYIEYFHQSSSTYFFFSFYPHEMQQMIGKDIFPSDHCFYLRIVKKLFSRNICEKLVTVIFNFSNFHIHSVEIRKIYSNPNFFRQIKYLVVLLVKSLFSRNFCQKRVRVNFRNFHTVFQSLRFCVKSILCTEF